MVKLGSVLAPIDRSEAPQPGTTYRLFGVKWWGEGVYEREAVDGSGTKYAKLARIETNDIVINKIWVRHGSVAVVPAHLSGSYGGNEFPTFVPDQTRLDPRWIHWISKLPLFWKLCEEKSFGSSGKNRIRPEKFLEIEIPLPPLDEQRRIVAHIDALAARIAEARELRQRALEERKAFIYAQARRTIEQLPIASTSLHHWTDGTREGIQTGPFGAQLGSDDFIETGYPVITIGNVQYNGLRLDGLKFVSNEKAQQLHRYMAHTGDILFARMGTVGRCCVVPPEADGWIFNYHIIRVAPDHARVDPRYLHWIIQASPDIEVYLNENIRGATRQGVNTKIVSNLPCRVPILDEQRRIVASLDSLQGQIELLSGLQTESGAELDALLPSVLDRAFKGELVIEQPMTLAEAFGLTERQLITARILLNLARVDDGTPHPVLTTPLMKHVFLVEKESGIAGDSERYAFAPYKFGPSSNALYEDLDALRAAGLISEKHEGAQCRQMIDPTKVSELQRAVEHLSDDILQKIDAVVRRYRDYSDNDLLLYVYARYPEYAVKSERQDIVKRAEKLRLEMGW